VNIIASNFCFELSFDQLMLDFELVVVYVVLLVGFEFVMVDPIPMPGADSG